MACYRVEVLMAIYLVLIVWSIERLLDLKMEGKLHFFYCHRRFLPMNHPYRCQSDKFLKGVIERFPPLPRPSGLEMLNEVSKYTEGHNGSSSYNDKIPGFGVKHNWVKKSIF
jgi:hypothetical protein